MRRTWSVIALVVGIIVWVAIVAMMVLHFVPRRQIYDQTNDTRRIFPEAYDIEKTSDGFKREFRWTHPSGIIQLFLKPNRGWSVVVLEVHASPLPVKPIPTFQLNTGQYTIAMQVHAGWRRVAFLVQPPAVSDGYTTYKYKLLHAAMADDRGMLGLAVHRVLVIPTKILVADWSWLLYIVIAHLLFVMLWYRLELPPIWLTAVGVWSIAGIRALLPMAEWYIPTDWHTLALCAYVIVLYVVRPLCRSREFTPLQMAVAVIVGVAGLRWMWEFGLLVLAIIYLWGPRTWSTSEYISSVPSPMERWFVPMLMGLAAVVRFWDLDTTGMGLFRDEARHGMLSQQILHGQNFAFSALASLPSGYFYLSAIPNVVFGPSPFAIRFMAALFGVLTIPVVLWVIRPLWGRQVALVMAALFTMSLWHISISRMGFPISLGPVVTLVALGAMDRSLRATSPSWQRLCWALVVGLMVGSMTLIYHSARMMPLVIAIFGLVFAWQRRISWQTCLGLFGLMTVIAAIVAYPIFQYATEYSYEYWYRIKLTSMVFWADMHGVWWGVAHLRNMMTYVGMWLVQGDTNPRQYSFGLPQLDVVTGSGFVVGLWLWWQYRRDVLTRAVAGWFAVTMIAGILSVDAPHAWRSAENLTPTLLLAAWGIVALMQQCTSTHFYRWVLAATVVGVVYSGGSYLAIQHTPEAYDAFDGQITAAVRMANQLNADSATQLAMESPLLTTDVGQYLLTGKKIKPILDVMPASWGEMPATVQRQVVISNVELHVQWPVPHFTYVARDAWGRPAYRVLCRGACQDIAELMSSPQMGTGVQ